MYAIRSYYGHAINLLQATASIGEISEDNVKASAGLSKTTDVDIVLKLARDGKILDAREKMIELIKVYRITSYNVCYTKLLR